MGHQPAGIALPAAFLRRAGHNVEAMDIAVEEFDAEKIQRASFAGISVPMHTALRLGLRVAREIRRINPNCHICFYGLYASLNADYLLGTVADSIIGGEFEQSLVTLIDGLEAGEQLSKDQSSIATLDRLNFPVPDRSSLPGLERYARLEHKGRNQLVGYVEASRGCLHHCTHCPIPPVYQGRFFVMPVEATLEDIRGLVRAGARHITFGDPDFLNGPTHSLRIVSRMQEEFPGLTFDFTAKVEHILKYRALIPQFAEAGCIFIVSAVESLSDAVLAHLDKGHTRADVEEAFRVVNHSGIALRPTFVSFTPWTTIDDFIEVLEFIERYELIDHVDPVQYSIRLLIPPGSLLLSRSETSAWLGPLVAESFTYDWAHPDPRLDELHKRVSQAVERAAREKQDAAVTFYRIKELAYSARGDAAPVKPLACLPLSRLRPPRLTEAWFC